MERFLDGRNPRNAQRDRLLIKEKRPLQPSVVLVVTSRKTRSSNCWRDLEGTTFATPALIAASRSCRKSERSSQSIPPRKRSSILRTLTPQPDPERSQRRLESRRGGAPPKAPASSRHCGPVALSTTAGNVPPR